MDRGRRQHMLGLLGLGVLLVSAMMLVFGLFGRSTQEPPPLAPDTAESAGPEHPIIIRTPDGAPRVLTGMVDANGEPITAACSTCHATRQPNLKARTAADLDEFHQGLEISHGNLSCLSCHNPENYDTLRLADGTSVQYQNVMQLCAQCHGPQYRDYLNGSHGGMTGYWDLSKGPRQRNNCVDCHDAHSPAFPMFNPVFPPKDRFRGEDAPRPHEGEHHE